MTHESHATWAHRIPRKRHIVELSLHHELGGAVTALDHVKCASAKKKAAP